MKRLLYIGNKLSRHGSNTTGIETLGPMLEREGFEVRYASDQKSKPLRMVDMAWNTLRFARPSRPVLIDTYSTSNFWYALIVSQLCRLLGAPYIPILHGGDLPKRLTNNPRLCALIFKHAKVNVAPSGYLFDAFSQAGFRKLIQIPNAITLADYPFKDRKNLAPRLLWVRSLASIYNPEMALVVSAEIKKEFPDMQLCMVGPDKDGLLERLQQKSDALGIDVTFTGRLSKSDWIALSKNFDIFLNTTHYDNMPVSVIEAMALGLPVVSTNVGGLSYLLEHQKTALLVADGDANEMAKCVSELLKNPQITQKLVQNAHNLTRGFDHREVAARWLEILK